MVLSARRGCGKRRNEELGENRKGRIEWKDRKKEREKKHFCQTICKILDPPRPVSQII
jgi:hypothetical protein